MLSEIFPPQRAIAETQSSQPAGSPSESKATTASMCPSLRHPTSAPDGLLSRLRVVGGLLTAVQAAAIAQLADRCSQGRLQLTNRANIQLRGQDALPAEALAALQSLGLASSTPAVDHLRNIMLSPTAGIDVRSLWDPRPLARQWEAYLAEHPELAVLSAKFSVGFDGGEAATIGDRPNDISLIATLAGGSLSLRLRLSVGDRGVAPQDVGVQIAPNQGLPVLAAFARVYYDYTLRQSAPRPPRFRDLLQDFGVESVLHAVAQQLPEPWQRCVIQSPRPWHPTHAHLGHHPQRQAGLSYWGVALPLGQMTSEQLRGIAHLAVHQGSGHLRLTPWQNLLIPDVPHDQIAVVRESMVHLGLPTRADHPWGAIVACSGSTGCHASATNTQADALALARHLEGQLGSSLSPGSPHRLINIHVTGCEKSCAQHHPADITLVGMELEQGAGYRVYGGDRPMPFGKTLHPFCTSEQIPDAVESWLEHWRQTEQRSD
jgi:ferredoxin-nitrite reductase